MLQVTLLGVWLVPAVVSIKMYFWRFCLVSPQLVTADVPSGFTDVVLGISGEVSGDLPPTL